MNTTAPGQPIPGPPFLAGGGEMATLIAAHDWAATPLGPIATWPAHVCTATALMLRSRVPMVMLWGEAGVMVYNDAYSVLAGQRHPALLGSPVREGWPEVAAFNDHVMKVGLAGGNLHYEDQEFTLHRNNRAEQAWMNLDYSPLSDAHGGIAGVLAVVVETTAQVLAVRHTGGIAHDFNNLLAAMSGSLQVLQRRLAQGQGDYERYLGIALNSVQHAAALTQRLLALSRRQTVEPKAVDVNQLVTGMEDMLRRSVGPAVELRVLGAPGLWPVRVDASQLENALLNLCINARDAMAPAGGQLTIVTGNQALDGPAAAALDVAPGEYVQLGVADTGASMALEAIALAADPFFTTKPLGHGTGLGLSMIYGFARQSGGQVRIRSEPGRGTTVHLYLPRHHDAMEQSSPAGEPEVVEAQAAGEVILLIEDEPDIRAVLGEELQHAGYRVLSADDGQGGLRWLQSDTRIDLLLTDVGLPGGLNGRQVAEAGRVSRPGLKVLFITGYAESSAVVGGLLEPGMEVLTKPFAIADLVAKVKDMVQRVDA